MRDILFILCICISIGVGEVIDEKTEELIKKYKPDLEDMVESEEKFTESLDLVFQIYDYNKDGLLNFIELYNLIKETCKVMNHPFPGKSAIQKLFTIFDKDGDKKLSPQELKVLTSKFAEVFKTTQTKSEQSEIKGEIEIEIFKTTQTKSEQSEIEGEIEIEKEMPKIDIKTDL